jgi:predicted  nucleic acid-binding Zn-ribbon protein
MASSCLMCGHIDYADDSVLVKCPRCGGPCYHIELDKLSRWAGRNEHTVLTWQARRGPKRGLDDRRDRGGDW